MSIPPPPGAPQPSPQYGAPQYGAQQPAPPHGAPPPGPGAVPPPGGPAGRHPGGKPPGRGMKRWGQGLTWAGAALVVLGIGIAILTGVLGFGNAVPSEDRMTFVHTTGTVVAEADEDLYLYVREGDASPVCTVYPPGQGEVHPIENPISTNFTHQGTQYHANGGFTVTESGTYEIECSTPEVLVAPSVSGGAIAGGVLGVVGGSLTAVAGGFVLVLGIVLWIIGANRMKKSGVR